MENSEVSQSPNLHAYGLWETTWASTTWGQHGKVTAEIKTQVSWQVLCGDSANHLCTMSLRHYSYYPYMKILKLKITLIRCSFCRLCMIHSHMALLHKSGLIKKCQRKVTPHLNQHIQSNNRQNYGIAHTLTHTHTRTHNIHTRSKNIAISEHTKHPCRSSK